MVGNAKGFCGPAGSFMILIAGGPSDSFNLGNGNGFSVREVIRTAEIVTGRAIKCVETNRRAGAPILLILLPSFKPPGAGVRKSEKYLTMQ